ncbi:MAG: hypothetical protein SZ59_C0004G0089 [candidate division TM6 bacterium GW2011_GWF2_28_16]|nr:MAG: hypothetical protein SZ59_C0004G0089 [candidate division TM6 bacterium GW2011_GWF2_28_16]
MKKLLFLFIILFTQNILADNTNIITQTREGNETKYEVIRPEIFNLFTPEFALLYPSQVIFLEAQRIMANLKSSLYEHTTTIDEYNGIYNTDCSGLVGYVLKYALNTHYLPIDAAKIVGTTRPLATDFYNFFNNCLTTSDTTLNPTGWMKIQYLRNALPGDIIVWDYKDDTKENTGHVVILVNLVEKFTESVTINNIKYWEYKVRIIDSSSSTHYQDTRNLPTNLTGQGVGCGDMYFGVNSAGEIKYSKWSSRTSTPAFENFAIGRAIQLPLMNK